MVRRVALVVALLCGLWFVQLLGVRGVSASTGSCGIADNCALQVTDAISGARAPWVVSDSNAVAYNDGPVGCPANSTCAPLRPGYTSMGSGAEQSLVADVSGRMVLQGSHAGGSGSITLQDRSAGTSTSLALVSSSDPVAFDSTGSSACAVAGDTLVLQIFPESNTLLHTLSDFAISLDHVRVVADTSCSGGLTPTATATVVATSTPAASNFRDCGVNIVFRDCNVTTGLWTTYGVVTHSSYPDTVVLGDGGGESGAYQDVVLTDPGTVCTHEANEPGGVLYYQYIANVTQSVTYHDVVYPASDDTICVVGTVGDNIRVLMDTPSGPSTVQLGTVTFTIDPNAAAARTAVAQSTATAQAQSTATAVAAATATYAPLATAVASATAAAAASATAAPGATSTAQASATQSSQDTATAQAQASATQSSQDTATAQASATIGASWTATATATIATTPGASSTPDPLCWDCTPSAQASPSPTPAVSPSASASRTPWPYSSSSPTATGSPTPGPSSGPCGVTCECLHAGAALIAASIDDLRVSVDALAHPVSGQGNPVAGAIEAVFVPTDAPGDIAPATIQLEHTVPALGGLLPGLATIPASSCQPIAWDVPGFFGKPGFTYNFNVCNLPFRVFVRSMLLVSLIVYTVIGLVDLVRGAFTDAN